MVDQLAKLMPDADSFRAWIARQVRFCSSLVDRITTGAPSPATRPEITSRLGYDDALLTVTEPHSFWAIEGDPAALRAAFPIADVSRGTVIFAPDIASYCDRKLRLLNGAHTALAPLALIAGVRTVREATEHPMLGGLLQQLLFDEIIPSLALPSETTTAYAHTVVERFRNPWLDHEWRVIATNQTAKFRVRVVPSIVEYSRRFGTPPPGLALALAASLWIAHTPARRGGEGWWSSNAHRIVDVDREMIARHWRRVDPDSAVSAMSEPMLARVAEIALGDVMIWGDDLRPLQGLCQEVAAALYNIQPGVSQ